MIWKIENYKKIAFNLIFNVIKHGKRYSIGRSDADNGVQYSWLWKLANVTQSPYAYVWSNQVSDRISIIYRRPTQQY